MRRRIGVTGPLPVSDVWERYAVPARWPEWAPHIRGVDLHGVDLHGADLDAADLDAADIDTAGAHGTGRAAARIVPGLRGRVRGPLALAVEFVVVEVDEPARTWSWDVRLGPVRLHLEHGVARHPRGTATWLTLSGPAPVVVAYLPVAYAALRRLVRP